MSEDANKDKQLSGVAVRYDRTSGKVDNIRSHLSSMLPEGRNAETLFETNLQNKAVRLFREKNDVVSSKSLNSQHELTSIGNYKGLTNSEKKKRGQYHLSRYGMRYEDMQPLNQLWQQYLLECLGSNWYGPTSEAKLLKADLHGAFLAVTKSVSPSQVGVHGIVVQETQQVFKIVTPENKVVSLIKRGCVFLVDLSFIEKGQVKEKNKALEALESKQSFVLQVDPVNNPGVLIYGDKYVVRSSERIVKKFKNKASIEM